MVYFRSSSRPSIFNALTVAAFTAAIAAMTLAAAQPARAQTYSVVHIFTGGPTDGALVNGDLIQDASGNLYGTTYAGGLHNLGVVFKMDPSGAVTILHSFAGGADGSHPKGGLFRDPTGKLYGTTTGGGSKRMGVVFALDANDVLTSLHSFKGVTTDGTSPTSTLVSISGNLYGTTKYGGLGCGSGCGTIFKVTKGGRETVLYRFTGVDGAYPEGLIRDPAGNLYGVTTNNIEGRGSVFKLDTAGVLTVLYTFTGGADGAYPMGRLILDTNGNLRGATENGGDPACYCGIVFRLDTSDSETVLYKFLGAGGGGDPLGGLLDVGGTVYGTTGYAGDLTCNSPTGCGLLYQIGKTGHYSVIHRFAGSAAGDGETPAVGRLTLGRDGSIYGTTWWGGASCTEEGTLGCGTIFKYTP